MTAGRPRKFESPEDIDAQAKAYFVWCDSQDPPRPYTITGLAEELGTFRDVLIDYESGAYDTETEKYSNAVKRAKAKVERYAEEHVYTQTAGACFHLTNLSRTSKNPWKNAQHQEVTGKDGSDLFGTVAAAITQAHKELNP